jgi:hypothetical protein
LGAVETELRARFPDAQPDGDAIDTNAPAYLLWMVEQVRGMDTRSVKEAVRAGRWMGYIFRWVEEIGLWDNARTREIVRADVRQADYDLPH